MDDELVECLTPKVARLARSCELRRAVSVTMWTYVDTTIYKCTKCTKCSGSSGQEGNIGPRECEVRVSIGVKDFTTTAGGPG